MCENLMRQHHNHNCQHRECNAGGGKGGMGLGVHLAPTL